jgi:hypothetical protein
MLSLHVPSWSVWAPARQHTTAATQLARGTSPLEVDVDKGEHDRGRSFAKCREPRVPLTWGEIRVHAHVL